MQSRELNTCKQDIYPFLHIRLPTNPRLAKAGLFCRIAGVFWLHGRVVLSFYRLFDVASHISSFIKEQNIRFFVYYRVRYNRTCVYNEKRGGVVYESTVQNDRNGYWRCFNNCYIYWGGVEQPGLSYFK